MGTLIFWQFVPLPFAAKSENYPTQQNISLVLASKKPPASEIRLYRGIALTEKDLKGMLKEEFDTYRISDQLPLAQKVIFCESGFQVDPKHNGISWGIAQFTKATWIDFGYGDIMNPQSQFAVMAKMWKRGLQGRWDCYKMQLPNQE